MSNLLNEACPITTLFSSTVVNAKGSYVQLVFGGAAGVTIRQSGYIAVFYCAIPGGGGVGGARMRLDIATGLAGFEVDKICNLGQANTSFTITNMGGYWQGYAMPWTFNTDDRLSARVGDANLGITAFPYRIKVRLFEKPI